MSLAMGLDIKVSGEEIKDTGLECKYGLMELATKGFGRRIKLMDRELSGT